MAAFHDLLLTVHGEIWDAGTEPRPELEDVLTRLETVDLPDGVTRLPTAAMTSGPHLAAQDEAGATTQGVVWLEHRIYRNRLSAWYALK